MRNELSNKQKISVAAASCSLAAAALSIALLLKVAPTYTEFIVGQIAWQAGTKLQDLIAPPVVVGVLFFSFVVLSRHLCRLKERDAQHADDFSEQLLWWSIPPVVTIAGLLTGTTVDTEIFVISSGALAVLTISSIRTTRSADRIDAFIVSAGLFASFLIALIPLEIALVRGRAPLSMVGAVNVLHYARFTYVLMGILFLVVLVLTAVASRSISRILPKFMVFGQLGLPLFFLALYPARLVLADGSITKYATTFGLKALVVALVAVGVIDVVRRYLRYGTNDDGNCKLLFSPFALFGLLMAFKFGSTSAPALSTNDYEFGQNLLGWWSYLKGAIPYVDYISPHGFIEDDLPGLVATVFYDATAASIADATRLTSTLLSLAAFLAIFEFSGSVGLALVSTFFIGGRLAFLFFTPFLCLWFSGKLRAKPVRWLAVWIVTAPIVVLGVPPFGIILVSASGLMALPAIWNVWRNRKQENHRVLFVAIALLLALALFTPFVSMLVGMIRYVMENAPINQVAYGIPWETSWRDSGQKSGFLFEAIRMSWIATPLFCLMMIYEKWRRQGSWLLSCLPGVVVLVFSLLLTPYTMGRIDPGNMSRGGFAAIFGWSVLIPIIAWHMTNRLDRSLLILVAAGMSSTLGYTVVSFGSAIVATVPSIAIGSVKDGAATGMPNVGRALVEQDQWDRLTKLNTLLSGKLSPDESYLDLTSHNAQMFYMGRLPEMAVTAPYNMAPVQQQQRAAEKLLRKLPRIALLDAGNMNYDGGGLALRDPVLYRFVIDHYVPSWEDGFILGYSKRVAIAADQGRSVSITIGNRTDDTWNKGVNRSEVAMMFDSGTPMSQFTVGTSVHLSNGEARKIIKRSPEQRVIWLDGGSLEPLQVGHPNRIVVDVPPKLLTEFNAELFDIAFSPSRDLGEVPVAWGHSDRALSKRMTQVESLMSLQPILRDLVYENGTYRVTGANPQVRYDVSRLNVSGRRAGLIRFRFACSNESAKPRLSVSWQGDVDAESSGANRVSFDADGDVLIVPVDTYSGWLNSGEIKTLSIDLDNTAACGAIGIGQLELYQRNVFR
ncbi:hypothetical protein [Paraburkholderia lacunae]|uniref:Uncharacterized protein n=1 Tax=Paraburkholderia lacunae TaxID=2211104 RepID=A0A370MZG7_9BURK|nr:hypothetical protein [Paraburkholderia lacunae]RDJ98745.1 hypothetical protein DLM46_31930 [Paraburkholderia lacunae]